MWSNSFTLEVAAASNVVSERGESLSPTRAPEMMAPAAIGAGIPSPWAMPIKAMPIVPAVPQEVPVTKEVIIQIINAMGRNSLGWIKLIQ